MEILRVQKEWLRGGGGDCLGVNGIALALETRSVEGETERDKDAMSIDRETKRDRDNR